MCYIFNQDLKEKLKSLLKFGIRYKDIFDFYYLINNNLLNKERLIKYIDLLIIKDENITQKTMNDIVLRLETILNNKRFITRLDNARSNWIDLQVNHVINNVIDYFKTLKISEV